ncbi:hypothetical protein HGRIS_010745 [Hohenbuehelia grisea]|uniref:Uncharacterized protein n=1 Tax=Hohenbuehelia grisea TaxID=104357 RepID=A0ABR3IXX5_9AGAR
MNEDKAAEAAGPPKKLTRTEAALEKEGISVAPPKRARAPSATLPPRRFARVASVA